MTRRVAAFGLLVGLALSGCLGVGRAEAATSCGSPALTITSTTTLADDYVVTATNGVCFIIGVSGANLHLNGHSITCSATSCLYAVEGSGVGDSTVVDGGTVTGPFTAAIENVGKPKNLTISGAGVAIVAHSGTPTIITGNVITGSTGTDIDVILYAATDTAHDNFIDGGTTGILVASNTSSSGGPNVHHNYIRNTSGNAIEQTSYGTLFPVRVQNNVIDSNVGGAISVSSGTLSSNICGDATACPTPTPPFVLP